MKSINTILAKKCVGCFSCVERCPNHCIKSQFDGNSFDNLPIVDDKKCINCGLCLKVCPIGKHEIENPSNIIRKSFVGINLNQQERICSSSGGVFYALAKHYISIGYIVYGSTIDVNGSIKHIGINNIDDIPRIIGSKYVRSEMSGVFQSIIKNLNDGYGVVFVGTGCQCFAVNLFVQNRIASKKKRLILIDFVCHGVGKPFFWNIHLNDLRKKYGSIHSINFRNKKNGWRDSGFSFSENGKEHVYPGNLDSYINAYAHNLCIRQSCFDCNFKGIDRHTDLTLGDAWGIDEKNPLNDNKGTSLIMVHTQIGLNIIKELFDLNSIQVIETEVDSFLRNNICITDSIKFNRKQISFERDFRNGMEFDEAVRINTYYNLFEKCLAKIKSILKKR